MTLSARSGHHRRPPGAGLGAEGPPEEGLRETVACFQGKIGARVHLALNGIRSTIKGSFLYGIVMLSESTARFIRSFFFNPDQFQQEVGQAGAQELAGALLELLRLYANDKNSSTLREWVVF